MPQIRGIILSLGHSGALGVFLGYLELGLFQSSWGIHAHTVDSKSTPLVEYQRNLKDRILELEISISELGVFL